MVVRFFRLEIKGTDEVKLNNIKNWINTKIELKDLDEKLGVEVLVNHNEINNDYVLIINIFIKSNISMNKYKDIIVNQFTGLNKDGLTSAKIIQYDNCSHDSENPQPCNPTTRMEWNK